jgi:hypothetical protein
VPSSVQNEVYTACNFVRLEFVFRAVLRASLVFFTDSNLRPFFSFFGGIGGGGKETRVKCGLSIFEVAGLASSALGGPAMTYL